MEGKRMKKRIISVLSFLMLVLCLTGCSTRITPQHIEELTAIATEVKNNPNYQMPEGYTLEYADNTKNNRIVIKTDDFDDVGMADCVEATFDITQEEVDLLSIEEEFDSIVIVTVIITVICCIWIFVLFDVCWFAMK